MLPAAHRSSTRLGGRAFLFLLLTAALVWALPTLRGVVAAQPSPEKLTAQGQKRASQPPVRDSVGDAKVREPGKKRDDEQAAMRTLRVHVLGPDGKPAPGTNVGVHAVVERPRRTLTKQCACDAHGQAVIELPLPVWSLRLTLSKDGYLTLSTGSRYEWLTAGRQIPRETTVKLTKPTSGQSQAIAELRKLDGRVVVEESDDGQSVRVFLAGKQITDADLARLHRLPSPNDLQIVAPNVTDAGLVYLESLHGLKTLVLSSVRITDAGLTRLESLQGLKELRLMGTHITDSGLVHLQALRNLEKLTLSCDVTDAGMKHLTPLKELRTLISLGLRVSPAKRRVLSGLEQPTTMEFMQTPLQDVCQYTKDLHKIEVCIDSHALRTAKINVNIPVTYKGKNVRLGEALHSLLSPLGLDWMVGVDALLITTRDVVAKRHPGVLSLQHALPNLKLVVVDW